MGNRLRVAVWMSLVGLVGACSGGTDTEDGGPDTGSSSSSGALASSLMEGSSSAAASSAHATSSPGGSSSSIMVTCDFTISSGAVNMNQAGRVYCLTGNVGSITVSADNVTLQGNGHATTNGVAINNRTGVIIRDVDFGSHGVDITNGGSHEVWNSVFSGTQINLSNNNRIENNTINAGSGYAAVQLLGNGPGLSGSPGTPITLITGNVVRGNTMTGSQAYDARFIRLFYNSGTVIEGNHVVMNSTGNMMQVHYSDHIQVLGNYMEQTVSAWDSVAHPTAPERYGLHIRDGTHSSSFIGNTVISDGSYCLLLNQPGNATVPWGHDNVVRGNKFYLYRANPAFGYGNKSTIRHMTTTGNDRFEDNLIYAETAEQGALGIDAALDANNPSHNPTYFINNTVIADNGFAMLAYDSNPNPQRARNNIFFSGNGPALSIAGMGPGTNISSESFYDFNAYFSTGINPNPIRLQRSCCGGQVLSLSGYRTALSGDGYATWEANSIQADPLFNATYGLLSGSPCINAGDPADAVPTGGGPRIDLGCFETGEVGGLP